MPPHHPDEEALDDEPPPYEDCPACSDARSCSPLKLAVLLLCLCALAGGVAWHLLAPRPVPYDPIHGTASPYGDPACPQMAGMVMPPCPDSRSPTPSPTPQGNATQ